MDLLAFSTERAKLLKRWKRNRDHSDGIDAVKDARTLYLKKRSSISDGDYLALLDATEYFPAAARTLQSFTGLVFRKKPVLDAPETLKALEFGITADGRSAEELAKLVFVEYCITNDGGVLSDQPDTPDGMNVRDAAALGYLPYQAFYAAEAIREIRYGVRNGRRFLKYVRLVEEGDETVHEFEMVGGIFRATKWELDKETNDAIPNKLRSYNPSKSEWRSTVTTPTINSVPMDFIPFVPTNDGTTGAAFDDLCAINGVHYQHSYNLAQTIAWISVPLVVTAGVDEDVEINMVPGAHLRLENENASWGFLEYTGQGVPSIERHLDRVEGHMSILGSRMLAHDKAASEAEGTIARRAASENSILGSLARHAGNTVQKSLRNQAKMMMIPETDVTFALNVDFVPIAIDPQLLAQLVALNQAGKLPDQALFEALQTGDVLNETWDYEYYQATIDTMEIDKPVQVVTAQPGTTPLA